MTVIAEAFVRVTPLTQNFSKDLDAQVQQAIGQTNKKALVSPGVDGKNLAKNLDKEVSSGINLVNKRAVITPKIDDKGASSRLGGALGKLDQRLQNVGKSGTVTSEVLGKLGVTGQKVSSVLSSGIALGTAAAAAAVTAFAVKGVHDFVALGTEIRNFQIISGASAQDASKLVAAADALHVSSQAAGTGVFFLEKSLNTAGPKLAALGVEIVKTKDGALDLSATFLNVADAVAHTEDPARRAQIAVAAFGKGGKALLPILEQGRSGIEKLFEEADKHGQILSQKQVDNAFKFNLALHELGQESAKFGRDLGSALVPALTKLVGLLDRVLQGVDLLGQGIAQDIGFIDRNVTGPLDSILDKFRQFTHLDFTLGLAKTTPAAKDTHDQLVAVNDEMDVLARSSNLSAEQLDKLSADLAAAGFSSEQAAGLIATVTKASADVGAQAVRTVADVNRLGDGITHMFGQTKHQVLDWQRGINSALNFVQSNLGNIASQLDQTAKSSSAAVDSASKSSSAAQNRVQLAQDRLAVFQAQVHNQKKLSASDLAREKLLQDQLSQAQDKAGTANENLAKAQHHNASAAADVLKAFDTNLQQMATYKRNFDVLIARNAPADLIKQLAELGQSGSSVVAALATANQAQFDKIVRDWRHARDQAPGVSKDIRHAFIKDGPIKIPIALDTKLLKANARAAKQDLLDQLGGQFAGPKITPQLSTQTMNVTAATVSILNKKGLMAGGPLGAGEVSLVGERGPELFVPKTAGTIVPNNRLGGFSSQDVDRLFHLIIQAIATQRPIQVTEVAQSPVATAEAVAARLGLAGVR